MRAPRDIKPRRATTLAAALAVAAPLGTASFVAPSAAHATVMVRRTIDELARDADAVVVGTARARTARWVSGRIFTDVDFEVDTSVRGAAGAGASLTVRTPGGVVGDTGQHVDGAPVLRAGARYVLFLRRRGAAYETLALSQGVLPVAPPSASGAEPTVMPAVTAGLVLTPPQGGAVAASVVVGAEGMRLDRFVGAVRAVR